MVESLQSNLAALSIVRLAEAAAIIREVLATGQGIRLGQSAVLSNKVHAFNAYTPEHVQILANADAGQFFYLRQDYGGIGHLDIFHECGRVDHQLTAQYICLALDVYRGWQQTKNMGFGIVNPDYVDIQTATGGGRITGRLQGGQNPSVRRVHENHVHVALLLPPDNLSCLFYIVAAVESAIMELGLELRCNECISYVESDDCKTDLSPYTDKTDSLLTGHPTDAQGQLAGATSSISTEPSSESEISRSLSDSEASANQGRDQTYVGMDASCQADNFANHQPGVGRTYEHTTGFSINSLYDSYKQALKLTKHRPGAAGNKKNFWKYQDFGSKAIACTRQCSTEIDVTATVGAAATRLLSEGITGRLRIHAEDIRYSGCPKRIDSDICLLVDSSGSMAGTRLQAARHIAGQICHFSRSRMSLLIFHDRQAAILQAFTTSRQQVLNAFTEIVPKGATPLALGIRQALAYIKEQQAKQSLLVLITDGSPSKRYDENVQPLAEALAAAEEVRKADCNFLCIGLDNEDGFLQKLTASAGGVLYSSN